jgi:radical SAM superfamily enzyme YgiQ (UPF0313 family)
MKVLFVQVGATDGWSSFYKGFDWILHSIGILIAILKREGHTVEYLDCRKFTGFEDIEQAINKIDFNVLMMSLMTVDSDWGEQLAKIVKNNNPETKVVIGGAHATLATSEAVKIKEWDIICTHEFELSLPKMMRDIESGVDLPRVIRGEMPPDLDALPFSDWNAMNQPQGETAVFSGTMKPYFSLVASRGCPGRCSFCQPSERFAYGNKIRKRSVDNVLAELESLVIKYGMKSYMVHDDNMVQFKSWVLEYCEKKMANPLLKDLTFACQGRADMICRAPEMMKSLYDAGLRCILIGFESGSDRVLQFIKKGTSVAQNLKAAEICHSLGIGVFANYLFGVPTETYWEAFQTAMMIRRIKPTHYSPSIFTPHPGTELYQYCLDHNLMLDYKNSTMYKRNAFSGRKIKHQHYLWSSFCIFWSMEDRRLYKLPWYVARRLWRMVRVK